MRKHDSANLTHRQNCKNSVNQQQNNVTKDARK